MKQKKLLSAVMGACSALLISPVAQAQTFKSGEINYEILSEENLTVAIAESDDYYVGITTEMLPETVEYNGKTYTVTAIAEWGLYGAEFDGDVVLPATITYIGEEALTYCEGSVVTLPPALEEYEESAFYTCLISGWDIAEDAALLATVDGVLMTADKSTIVSYPAFRPGATYTVPEYVARLGDYMLYEGAEYLEEMIFHSGLEIGRFAFKDAGNMTRIEIPSGVTLSQGSFTGCEGVTELILHEGITVIPVNCFFDLCSITSLTLPQSLEKIDRNGFGFCEMLESITFPDNLKEIEMQSFSDCYALTTVDFNKLEIIGESAFVGCPLNSVFLPEVTTVGEMAFSTCSNLVSFEAPKLKTLGASAFFRCPLLNDVKLPEGLESIEGTAFYECSGLQSLTIPSSIQSIGRGILTGTTGMTSVSINGESDSYTVIDNVIYTKDLTTAVAAPCGIENWDVTLPASVTTVAQMAFRKCANLNRIALPSGLETIESNAFADCTGLTSVVSLNPIPPTGCAFPDVVYSNATLYVADDAAVTAYSEAAGWSNFTDIKFDQLTGVDDSRLMNSIIATEYYDLQGHRIDNPTNGMYIRQTKYNNGTIKTNKLVIK